MEMVRHASLAVCHHSLHLADILGCLLGQVGILEHHGDEWVVVGDVLDVILADVICHGGSGVQVAIRPGDMA